MADSVVWEDFIMYSFIVTGLNIILTPQVDDVGAF